MFWLLVILIVIGVVAVLGMRSTAVRSRRSPSGQPTIVQPDPSPAGRDQPATRADGQPIPGSEEDRHRHGKP